MAKKRQSKKDQPAISQTTSAMKSTPASSPFLAVAHPPARTPTLLAVSGILFVVWFIFLLLAAISG